MGIFGTGSPAIPLAIASCGWHDVRYRNLTVGIVALHVAERYRPEIAG